MADLFERVMHAFDGVAYSTIQLTAIIGIAWVYFGYQYFYGDVPTAPVVASARSAPASKTVKGLVKPLKQDPLSSKAHAFFTSYPTVTISSGCLHNTSPSSVLEMQIIDIFREAANISKLHVIVFDDSVDGILEARTRGVLEAAGLVGTGVGQVPSHRILACSTTAGKVAIVRQIEPAIHLESESAVSAELNRFKQRLLTLQPPPLEGNLVSHILQS